VDDLDDVFAQLRPLLTRHADSLVVICDEPGDLQLESKRSGPSGTRMTFGALKTRGEAVSLLFMPVYSHADLLDGVSDELRARMVGRSAFTFTPDTVSPALLDELSALVDAGLDRYRADKLA
jgi:hypothetical protein